MFRSLFHRYIRLRQFDILVCKSVGQGGHTRSLKVAVDNWPKLHRLESRPANSGGDDAVKDTRSGGAERFDCGDYGDYGDKNAVSGRMLATPQAASPWHSANTPLAMIFIHSDFDPRDGVAKLRPSLFANAFCDHPGDLLGRGVNHG